MDLFVCLFAGRGLLGLSLLQRGCPASTQRCSASAQRCSAVREAVRQEVSYVSDLT